MPSKSKTQTRKSLNLSQCEPKDITEDEIDEMIRDITLKHPRSAYCLYIMENLKKQNKRQSLRNSNIIFYKPQTICP